MHQLPQISQKNIVVDQNIFPHGLIQDCQDVVVSGRGRRGAGDGSFFGNRMEARSKLPHGLAVK